MYKQSQQHFTQCRHELTVCASMIRPHASCMWCMCAPKECIMHHVSHTCTTCIMHRTLLWGIHAPHAHTLLWGTHIMYITCTMYVSHALYTHHVRIACTTYAPQGHHCLTPCIPQASGQNLLSGWVEHHSEEVKQHEPVLVQLDHTQLHQQPRVVVDVTLNMKKGKMVHKYWQAEFGPQ